MISTAAAVLVAAGYLHRARVRCGQSAAVDLTAVICHLIRVRLADPAAAGLRAGQHPGPGHAVAVPAAHPAADGRPAGGLRYRRVAAANVIGLSGSRSAWPTAARVAHRGSGGPAAGAVLHGAGPVGHDRPGQCAALAPGQGLRGLPVRPAHSPVRTVHAGRAEAGGQRPAHRRQLRRCRRLAALAAAGPGRTRRRGRLGTGTAGDGRRRGWPCFAAVIVVLAWLWVRALGRAMVSADTSTQSAEVRARGAAVGPVRPARRGDARYWVYQRRDPSC